MTVEYVLGFVVLTVMVVIPLTVAYRLIAEKWPWDRHPEQRFVEKIRWKGEVYCEVCGDTLQPYTPSWVDVPLYDPFLGTRIKSPAMSFMTCSRARSDISTALGLDFKSLMPNYQKKRLTKTSHMYYWNPNSET